MQNFSQPDRLLMRVRWKSERAVASVIFPCWRVWFPEADAQAIDKAASKFELEALANPSRQRYI